MSHLTVILLFDKRTEHRIGRLVTQASQRIGRRWRTPTYMTKTRIVHYPAHLSLSSRLSPVHAPRLNHAIKRLATNTKPFYARFDGFGVFKGDLNVLYAKTNSPQIHRLHHATMKAINTITPHKHTYPAFTPHMTVIADRNELATSLYREWGPDGLDIDARATHLGVLMVKDGRYRITRFAL